MRTIFYFFISFFVLSTTASYAHPDKALERVNQSRELNCGVYVLGTIFSYDKKGEPTGFTADLFQEVANRTGLRVKYSEISSFGTLYQDLDAGKYDMICSPVLLLPATTIKFLPGEFIAADDIGIYADSTLDTSGIKVPADMDNSKYTFVGMDGELGGLYVPKMFPHAKLTLLSMGLPPTHMFMELFTKKAQFMVLSRIAAQAYLKENPGKIKQVTAQPILKASVRLFYPTNSFALRTNIEAVVDDIRRDGTLEKLLSQHGLLPDVDPSYKPGQ